MIRVLQLAAALTLAISAANTALACDQAFEAARPLKLAYPAHSALKNPVDVSFALDGSTLRAHFEVRNPHVYAKPQLGPKEYPYQYDVVELFVSVAGMDGARTPYFEFELSPYDQTFEVKIIDLKKPFIDGVDMGLTHSTHRTAQGWSADLAIPLENLGWNGDPTQIVGNAYSIFGRSPNRSYWGLTLPQEPKPNFHTPQYFQPLVNCSEH